MKKINLMSGFHFGESFKKLLLIMRITTCLIMIASLQVSAFTAYSQDEKVTLNGANIKVSEIINQIENQTDYLFFYSPNEIDLNRQIAIDANKSKVSDVLATVFNGTDVKYLLVNEHIVLTNKEDASKWIISADNKALLQGQVTGKVTTEKGEPIPGVSVVVKGTTTGTVTDVNGNYTLSLPDNAKILEFSFIGMTSQEISIGAQTVINVVLKEAAVGLDEYVVVGYGKVKKSDVTGSVASISQKDMGELAGRSLTSLIQGRAAGVDVVEGKVRVRGVTTLNNTDPLTVIDGFPGGNLSTLNSNDIESIEILKDASATAIYGSRGANGVILVTTKSGQAGKLKISVNAFKGIKTVPRYLDVLNATQYVDYVKDALSSGNQAISEKLNSDYVKVDRTDWQKEVFRIGNVSEVSVSLSGGSENATHFLGLGYQTGEEIVQQPSSSNFFLKNKNDFKIAKWLKVGTNLALNYNKSKNQWDGMQNYETILNAINFPTYFPKFDETVKGGYSVSDRDKDLSDVQNPLTSVMNTHPETNSLSYQGQAFVKIEPISDLVLTVQGGVNGSFSRSFTWIDTYAAAGGIFYPNALKESSAYGFSPLIESYLSYSKTVGKHYLKGMVGNSWQNNVVGGGIEVSGSGFDSDIIKNINVAPSVSKPTQSKYIDSRLAYFGRLEYSYNSKYLATFNFRQDASPNFAPKNRWGKFPSVALGWKINEEGFMKSQTLFSLLKLRAGWGKSGNDAIGQYKYQSLVWNTGIGYPLGALQTYATGATIRENFSPDIKWETTESSALGLDFALMGNKITGTVEVFQKETSDILFTVPRPWSMGYGSSWSSGDAVVNAANVKNKGVEFQLAYKGNIREITYSVNGNYTFVHNEVVSLGAGQPYLDVNGISKTEIGSPIGYFYGYVADGVFMNQTELNNANTAAKAKGFDYYQDAQTQAGDVRFKDVNGDGKVTPEDRTMIGNSIPKHMFGLNLDLGYKGFDFNMYWQGVAGVDIFDASYYRTGAGNLIRNQRTNVLDRWRSESDPGNGIQPRATFGDPAQNARPSSLMVEDGSYFKLKQFTVGYSLPKKLLEKAGIERVRFYISGTNLFAITKYTGYDPEVGGDNLSRGVLWVKPPSPRQLIMGVNFQF